MSDCCPTSKPKEERSPSCCEEPIAVESASKAGNVSGSSCCPSDDQPRRFDFLLWGGAGLVLLTYLMGWQHGAIPLPEWLQVMSHGVFELMNTMWWGVLIGAVFVGVLGRIPQAMITAVLGQGGKVSGIVRATLSGVLLDLCSHGILMVGMQLYQRGASIGQVMAFLIASPWNSFSLTIILVALIGLPWTLAFIGLSMAIAVVTGCLFDTLVSKGQLPSNPNTKDLPENYVFWVEFRRFLRSTEWSLIGLWALLWDGLKGSRMVLRWLFFGVLLATAIRGLVSVEDFQDWFGPSVMGLMLTLLAATIIEVCSEGSTPIAADIMTRASAPGNSFAFLMTGVSTDYTEVMVLKDTTRSWKMALFLPLLTVPQVVVVALILNGIG